MSSSRQIVVILLTLALLPAASWAAPQKTPGLHRIGAKNSARRPPEPVAQPAPAVPPPTPEQMPAQPPQVSYLNGQLTIISRNSTLGDILRAVARQTGANIELPPGAGFERVAGRMGPGPARNVLAELLNGSRYDYVMIASATNPGGLQHVVLTPKTAGSESPAPNQPVTAYQPSPQPDQQVVPNEPEIPPDAAAEEPDASPDEGATSQDAPEPPPASANDQPNYGAAPQQPGAQPAPGVKTPEQLLQELQRMQQQQQQQQNPQQ